MATQPADLRMSLAEFRDWDDGTDTRYELIDGRVVAMAPPSPRHSALTGQLARLVGNALKLPCLVFVEAGIVTPDRPDTYLQADLAVSCRSLEQHDRDVAEPVLVVEVESPGTVRHEPGRALERRGRNRRCDAQARELRRGDQARRALRRPLTRLASAGHQ